jgi:uncharacterized membrane protein
MVDVLVDEAHGFNREWIPGEVSIMAAYLNHYDFNVTSVYEGELTQEILSNYEILVLMFPAISYTGAEIAAVQNFVQQGGNLLLVGTAYLEYFRLNSPVDISNQQLNDIANLFNVTFNDDAFTKPPLSSEHFLEHPITTNVSSMVYKDGCTINHGNNVTTIIQYDDGSTLAAAAEVDSTRVVFFGTVFPLNWLVDERLSKPTDNYQFLLNVFNWLAHRNLEIAALKHPLLEVTEDGPLLAEEEKDQFTLIRGAIHLHTSDVGGASDPSDVIVERARELSYDFLVLCDYDNFPPNPLIGAINARNYIQERGYDMHIVSGVEANRGWGHVSLFPITLDVWEREFPIPDLEGMVPIFEEIVDGGGIVEFNHPTLLEDPNNIYYRLEDYSMNAIEIINSAIQVGIGDAAVRYPFTGACDAHSVWSVDRVIQYLYVRNNTDVGIVDAILNKRSIIYTPDAGLWIGQKVWLDEYFSRMDEVEPVVANAGSVVSSAQAQGRNVTLASTYLSEATDALTNMNPDRAKKYSTLATTAAGITATLEDVPAVTTGDATTATVSVSNLLTESIPLTLMVDGANWTFPAGNTLDFTVEPGETKTSTFSVIPQASGSLSLTAELLYGRFALSTDAVEVQVSEPNLLPTAAFTYQPTDPKVQETVSFVDSSEDPDGTIVSWQWDFGDGDTSITEDPTHQYDQDGTYTVTLEVTDDSGEPDTTSVTITVSKVPSSIWAQSWVYLLIGAVAGVVVIVAGFLIRKVRTPK